MKRVISTDIKNTISGETKKKLKKSFVVPVDDVVFAVGPESWLRDGREDIAVSPIIVGSLILANDTDNRVDGVKRADSDEIVPHDKTAQVPNYQTVGNPVLWGSLSSVQITIMGTDAEPVRVISAAGRQTAKAKEYLNDLLRRLRVLCQECYIKCERERAAVTEELATLTKSMTKKGVEPAPEEVKRVEELRAAQAAFGKATLDAQATKRAMSEATNLPDPVLAELSEQHMRAIFYGVPGSKFGKPLATRSYGAVYYLSASYSSDLPTDRRSLEKSKLANFQVPSPPSAEANSTWRLVREYVLDGTCTDEAQALDRVRQYVRPLMAVGAEQAPTPAYVEQLYKLAMVIPEAQAAVDKETDPRKMLALFEKVTKKLVRAVLFEEERGNIKIHLTGNEMPADEQLAALDAILYPPKRPKKPTAPSVAAKPAAPPKPLPNKTIERLQKLRSPMSSICTDAQRAEVRAIIAWESFRSGDIEALAEFPHLRAAVEEEIDPEDTVIGLARYFADGWNGRAKVEMRPFAEKRPKDEKKVKEWERRMHAHQERAEAAQKLVETALAAAPKGTKADELPNYLKEKLEKM